MTLIPQAMYIVQYLFLNFDFNKCGRFPNLYKQLFPEIKNVCVILSKTFADYQVMLKHLFQQQYTTANTAMPPTRTLVENTIFDAISNYFHVLETDKSKRIGVDGVLVFTTIWLSIYANQTA